MKKTFTRLFSLLLVLCMVGAMPATALAADETDDNFSFDGMEGRYIGSGKASELELDSFDELTDPEATVTPYVICRSGVLPGIKRILIYPVYLDRAESAYYYSDACGVFQYAEADSAVKFPKVTKSNTQALLDQFHAETDYEANAWLIRVYYNLYTDGKGSYGKYFELTPVGGTATKYDIDRNTSSSSVSLPVGLFTPPDMTATYKIGYDGAFYCYNIDSKTVVGTTTAVSITMNA